MALHRESDLVQLNKTLSQKPTKALHLCSSYLCLFRKNKKEIIPFISNSPLPTCLMTNGELWFVARHCKRQSCIAKTVREYEIQVVGHYLTVCGKMLHLLNSVCLASAADHSHLNTARPSLLYQLPLWFLPPSSQHSLRKLCCMALGNLLDLSLSQVPNGII